MTDAQIDYLWQLAGRDGDQLDLQTYFPEVDWIAATTREDAQWEAARARWALEPHTPSISQAQLNEVLKEVFTTERVQDLFTSDSPLMGKLRR